MNTRKLTFTLCVLFCFLGYAQGQDLHAYYDAQTDSIYYEINGKRIKNPKVKKGANIFLHVQNYNNYLYDANVKANNIEINLPSSAGNNPLTGFMGIQGGAGAPNFNLLDIAAFKGKGILREWLDETPTPVATEGDGDISGFANADAEAAKFTEFKQELNATISALDEIENEFMAIGGEVKAEVEARKIRGIAAQEIDKIKYNPHLSPKQIKRLSQEYLNKVFKEDNVQKIDLDDVLALSDVKSTMEKNIKKLDAKAADYSNTGKRLQALQSQAAVLGFASEDQAAFNAEVLLATAHMADVEAMVKKDRAAMESMATEESNVDLELITALRNEFEIMKENDFTRTFRAPAKGDYVNFDLSFMIKDSSRGANKPFPVSEIEVPVAGGFKMNASLGISFGQFADQPQEYFIRDDQIVATDQGNFLPILTSFLHFYMQGARATSLGGTLGIGFPIVNTGNDQSLYFFAGPSLILGKSSRIVISGGIMGGKVKRLGAGYNIGDAFFDDTSVLPIVSKYEIGYFLGLSYNLGGS